MNLEIFTGGKKIVYDIFFQKNIINFHKINNSIIEKSKIVKF